MTGTYIAWAMDQELPCAQKFVLFVMGDNGGTDAIYTLGIGHLATRCGLSISQVERAIKQLIRRGLIREIVPGGQGRRFGLLMDTVIGASR